MMEAVPASIAMLSQPISVLVPHDNQVRVHPGRLLEVDQNTRLATVVCFKESGASAVLTSVPNCDVLSPSAPGWCFQGGVTWESVEAQTRELMNPGLDMAAEVPGPAPIPHAFQEGVEAKPVPTPAAEHPQPGP